MKIAYLNPWENAAENQAYHSLAAAARNLGHELVDCRTAREAEQAAPEFIISVASSIPKVVDAPTYLTMHEPTKRFLENPFYLKNLFTYDGFLTISDSLAEFVHDIAFGVVPLCDVGFYYNTPQTSNLRTDIQTLARQGQLRIVYIGTNWDQRLPVLFRTIDETNILQIHGPQASWVLQHLNSYAGPLPFDGIAPQKAYATNGIGLVLLSAEHLQEDVISNRIFEISSAGAISICPSTPWIRKWFGNSVLYFDPRATATAIAKQVIEHYEFCRQYPCRAQLMADKARAIYERHFAAERLLTNAINYHHRVQALQRLRLVELGHPPHISVIVRCGGRPVEMVSRAVDSIRRQTFGSFSIILSKYRPIDVSAIVSEATGSIVSITEILTEGGNRSATLLAGCGAVKTEYFAVLDDDDFWLSDHVESLFVAGRAVDPAFDVAFSGTICVGTKATQIERSLSWDRNIYTFGFRDRPSSVLDITREFASNCFVARSELLVDGCLDVPQMETAEDSLLVAMITRRKRPIFSYKATAFFHRGHDDQSDFDSLSSRQRDLRTLALRTGSIISPSWINSGSLQGLLEVGPA